MCEGRVKSMGEKGKKRGAKDSMKDEEKQSFRVFDIDHDAQLVSMQYCILKSIYVQMSLSIDGMSLSTSYRI